ncbi:hypothetical protein BJY00DRAFT_315623 [Aspergillus carlsbadensis]|nr:hypothetical protein BJY00DRAFT_315623 [Aspergillus carlsbadensis]
MSQRPIPSPQPGDQDDAFSLDTYLDLNTTAPPDSGFMPATTSMLDLDPNASGFVASPANGGSFVEVPPLGSDASMTWIPGDMQSHHTPELDLSTTYLHFNGTSVGYHGNPQHHAFEGSTHHTGQGTTSYLPNGTGSTSTHQPFFNSETLLRGRSGGVLARTVTGRPGPHLSVATTATTPVGVYQ